MVVHRLVNKSHAENFTRPASAPEMRAVEMMAKVTWKAISMTFG